MFYSHEVVSRNAVYFNQVEVNEAEVQSAIQLINGMAGHFDPDNYYDRQYDQTQTLITEKFEGREYSVDAPIPDAPTEPIGETLAADLARLYNTNRTAMDARASVGMDTSPQDYAIRFE
jgi:non-homologous end joining protein Ku